MKRPPLIETGFHDVRGIPICVGDLIRVKHFKHYRRREQMWLYVRVERFEDHFVVWSWDKSEKSHRCLLKHCGLETAEVLTGPDGCMEDGSLMMWNERKRLK